MPANTTNDTVSNTPQNLRERFWEKYALDELTTLEWEALCDGCGLCCLVKFLDDDDDTVEYTDVACKLLDCTTGLCSDYANRKKFVPDCIGLTIDKLADMKWLPKSCAYKRLYLNQGLPHWHYLVAGWTRHKQQIAKIGAGGRVVSEVGLSDEVIEERIVRWVKF